MDIVENKIHFINKSDGQTVFDPYTVASRTISGVCIGHADIQPLRPGTGKQILDT